MKIGNASDLSHYYGDIVRILFLVSGIIMLVGLPDITGYIRIPVFVSILCILILGIAAGLTNPKQIFNAAINTIIASVGFLVFETYAVITYRDPKANFAYFIANLILGFVFLLATYFSVKTFRGLILKNDSFDKE